VDFRTVHFPGVASPRRVRVCEVPNYGLIETEGEAEKVLRRIQAELQSGKALYQVLQRYRRADAPENRFLTKWLLFCDDKQEDVASGRLRPDRVRELRAYVDRGYFRYFIDNNIGVDQIDTVTLSKWLREMRAERQMSLGQRQVQKLSENHQERHGGCRKLPTLAEGEWRPNRDP
jgi:hypothetical protein